LLFSLIFANTLYGRNRSSRVAWRVRDIAAGGGGGHGSVIGWMKTGAPQLVKRAGRPIVVAR
jgi:hypothetical protein